MLVQRVAMRKFGTYTPVSEPTEKDLAGYYRATVSVSFEPDGCSNPVTVAAYGRGFDAWYVEVK